MRDFSSEYLLNPTLWRIAAEQQDTKLTKLAPCRKYQFMEVNTQRRLAGLQEKVPDIRKTLEMARFLKTRKVGYGGTRGDGWLGVLTSIIARLGPA